MNEFFIAGCQRSGTTLMRLILSSHSMIRCFDESEGYKLLTVGKLEQLDFDKAQKLVGFKIPRFSEQLLWATMSDTDYGEFPSFYHGAPVIFLVRDYRDVIYSMAQLRYPDGESWLRKHGQRILKFQAGHPEFKAEYKKILTTVEQAGFPDHLVGALYWKYKTDALFSLIDARMPVIGIAYEDLVNNPKNELAKLVDFLGLQWENALLQHNKLDHAELDADGMAIGGTNPKLPIHKNSVKAYGDFFSPQELKDMRATVNDTLSRLSGVNIEHDNGG